MTYRFYEFFAGGGMVRQALGARWTCGFANDFDPRKAAAYAANFDADHLHVGDVAEVRPEALPGRADLAWASFPCQDLSLAGKGAGLGEGSRSAAFWSFWGLMQALKAAGRAPRLIALENVTGLLTARGGADFAAICDALAEAGYRFGAMMIDAACFVPQSRPRIFIVATLDEAPPALTGEGPDEAIHPPRLREAAARLRPETAARWVWWRWRAPAARNKALSDLIEEDGEGVAWMSEAETRRLLGLMTPGNLDKLRRAGLSGRREVGTAYRRTRVDEAGARRQRAEARFDGLAGCLRTPGGGSSRQTILVVEGERVRARLMTAREAARLMGLPDEYRLPSGFGDAYRIAGDGVAVDVVRHLAETLFEPLLDGAGADRRAA